MALPANDWIWDNLLFARYNICVVLRHIFDELHLSHKHDLVSLATRREMFSHLAKWSQAEKMLKDEQVRKKLV